jgi:thiamine kinase-like enzyme
MNGLGDIVERLEPSLGPLSGEPAPLDGGITNRNFRVTLGGDEYVVRVHGRDTELLGIDRRAERLASETAAGLAIAPQVVASFEDCQVTRFVACTAASASDVAERVEEIARALRGFHDSDVRLPTTFWVPDLLANYAQVVHARGGTLPAGYADAVDAAARIAAALPVAEARPCHNDLLTGNIICASGAGAMLIVDWEYAGMGHRLFDLGNLSVNNDFDDVTDERLLGAYHGHPPTRWERAALKLMRLLSDAREAAWGVVQASVSELDFDFEGYAHEHFERLRAALDQTQLQRWLADAQGEWEAPGGQAA